MNRAATHAREMMARSQRPTPARVSRELIELGRTADEIADRLRALEIKGVLSNPCRCPVAQFMARLGVPNSVVSRSQIEFGRGRDWHIITTPGAVAAFLRNFDRGVYLDLVLTEAASQ